MATNPQIDNNAALAINPPRANIFARPDTRREARDEHERRSVFDAACGMVAAGDRPDHLRASGTGLGSLARLAAALIAAAAIAVIALREDADEAPERHRPTPAHSIPTSERHRESHRPAKRARPAAAKRRRAGTRRRRLVRRRAPAAVAQPRPPHPPVAPPPQPPQAPAPRRALPAPVAPTSPPEFM